jgi:hypothetical protein
VPAPRRRGCSRSMAAPAAPVRHAVSDGASTHAAPCGVPYAGPPGGIRTCRHPLPIRGRLIPGRSRLGVVQFLGLRRRGQERPDERPPSAPHPLPILESVSGMAPHPVGVTLMAGRPPGAAIDLRRPPARAKGSTARALLPRPRMAAPWRRPRGGGPAQLHSCGMRPGGRPAWLTGSDAGDRAKSGRRCAPCGRADLMSERSGAGLGERRHRPHRGDGMGGLGAGWGTRTCCCRSA